MKSVFKLFTAFVLTLNALAFYAPAALAAAPSNDTFPNATVASVGFSETLNTGEATTDADDAQMNASCGAPATDASVWYAIQGTDTTIVVDVSSSNYSAGVLVGVGTQGNLNTVACGPGATAFFAASGTTYYVLAIDDQQNGDGLNGGTLNIAFSEVQSPILDSFTVNRYGTFNPKTGVATISGTYSCSRGDFLDIFIEAHQSAGRFMILGSGEFFDSNTCDGSSHKWTANVYPQSGKFAGGKAMTFNYATLCGAVECTYGYAEQKVTLRGK